MMYRILLIEDDQSLAELLKEHLKKYDYDCMICSDFKDISAEVEQFVPHLILLDINLPKYDGFFWCRKIRRVSRCPIIMISARSSEMEQIFGIENGADDYITKPFTLEFVVTKVNGQIRRTYGDYASNRAERIIVRGDLRLHPESLILENNGRHVSLTKKEAMLAAILLENVTKVLSRETLLTKLWDDESFVEENTLNVNIARLRKKLQDVGAQAEIVAVRGVGYRLIEEII